MEITRVDPSDAAAVAAWHAAWSAGASAGRVDPPVYLLSEVEVQLREDNPDRSYEIEAYAAIDGGVVVGGATLEYPLRDNLRLAEIEVDVPVERRGRGVGGALYEHLLKRVESLGRGIVATAIQQPIGGDEVPAVAFATKRGFTKRNTEIRRVLRLPVDTARLDALAAEAAPHMDGYRVETWTGPCPEAYAEQYAHLKSLLMTDAPTGEMDYEQQVWDVARLRADEDITAKQGRTVLTAVAVAPDGSLAGHTQIGLPGAGDGQRSFQWDTLVLRKHRGHRLGLALKVANLRALMAEHPERDRNETWNASQNAPMNAVNDKLGFQSIEEFQEWQRDAVAG
ncbi:MAG TPA: GNAT family N-acetyltransferase [Stackebrandtia sp.]|jgi:GNAT superfamily N-acetyltransferase|uniref:GNAT family N-acetyltransferase n=1 Tax=Stackebrandtia sp. TaxID=2023065 RepID=UPI002D46C451|nr:GNAT family N-acetyltransferase [Stackebrandtia sp.]HZE37391.1 GNAT family N-acetyltransferase [Stackebrandtia sp.]